MFISSTRSKNKVNEELTDLPGGKIGSLKDRRRSRIATFEDPPRAIPLFHSRPSAFLDSPRLASSLLHVYVYQSSDPKPVSPPRTIVQLFNWHTSTGIPNDLEACPAGATNRHSRLVVECRVGLMRERKMIQIRIRKRCRIAGQVHIMHCEFQLELETFLPRPRLSVAYAIPYSLLDPPRVRLTTRGN